MIGATQALRSVENCLHAALDPAASECRVRLTEKSTGVDVFLHVEEDLIDDDAGSEVVERGVGCKNRPQVRRLHALDDPTSRLERRDAALEKFFEFVGRHACADLAPEDGHSVCALFDRRHTLKRPQVEIVGRIGVL